MQEFSKICIIRFGHLASKRHENGLYRTRMMSQEEIGSIMSD